MAIPDYESIMLPLLRFAGDKREHSLREAIEALAAEFRLTEEEQKQLLPSGRQRTFDNRVGWARTYMKKADLLESPRRGYFRITPRGLQVLDKNPPKIDVSFLKQFSEFVEFRSLRRETAPSEELLEPTKETPIRLG
jgi:restriction system protein